MEKELKKVKVLIDSDVANEIDDQFALAYAFSRQQELEILGITIAPFRVSWQKELSIRDGMIDSKNEAYRILRLFGIKHSTENPFVYLGCDGYLEEGYDSSNPGVQKIIDVAKENKKVVLCCLGTLTNLAMALRIEPKIANKLKVVWLGTDNIFLDSFEDSNYRKDKTAFYEVLKSKVDLTIFPTYLARSFVTSTYEFSKNIKSNHVANYLNSLMNRFIFTEANMGIKTIYDIGPIAYILNGKKFEVKDIDAQLVSKDKKIELPIDRKVHYIVSVPKNSYVWIDFLNSINSVKNFYLKPEIFFTSDTHFNQEKKVRLKQVPFKSVEEMNKELVKRWNNKVGPNDIVYHLGDFGDYDFVKKLNGKITLICGNYEKKDFGKDFDTFRNKLLKLGFDDVIKDSLYLDEKILGEKVLLVHKPTDHANDCISLFGHVHNLALVKKFGFNVCTNYHYFSPINKNIAKRYVNFVKNWADDDVFA